MLPWPAWTCKPKRSRFLLHPLEGSLQVVAKLTKRLECLIDPETDAAIDQRAREIAGNDDPRMYRSRAARELIAAGIAKVKRAVRAA